MKLKRLFIALLLGFVPSLVSVSSAAAHTDVVSTSPADGSVTEVPPAFISITFSEPPITAGAAVVLTDAAGNEFPVGEVAFDGAKVSVASAPDLPPNEYLVTWRVSAQDGHVLTGEFSFTYSGDAVVSNVSPLATAYAVDSEAVDTPLGVIAESSAAEQTSPWTLFISALVIGLIVGTIFVTRKRK